MADSPLPDVVVQVAFGSTWRTEPSDMTWTEITPYVMFERELAWRLATRSSEFDSFGPGGGSLVLLNKDRRFDPANEDGDYFGDLVPGVPIRLLGVATGDDFWFDYWIDVWVGEPGFETPLAFGFVDDWAQDVPNQLWAEVPVAWQDGFGILGDTDLPSSWYELVIQRDEPRAFWRMGALRDGDTMLDSSGNGAHGLVQNVTTGQASLVNDSSDKAIGVAHIADARGIYRDLAGILPNSPPVTWEWLMKVPRDGGEFKYALRVQVDSATESSNMYARIYTDPGDTPDGELEVRLSDGANHWRFYGSTRVDDDAVHHIALVFASSSVVRLYVDGELETLTTVSGGLPISGWPGTVTTVGNTIDRTSGDYGLGGDIDEVAIYQYALSAATIAEHARIARSGGPTDPAERLTLLLDHVGWPQEQRDFAGFDVEFGEDDFDLGGKLLPEIQRIEKSEQGRIFIGTSGEIVQLNRHWYLETKTTPDFTLSDDEDDVVYGEPKFGSPRDFIKNDLRGSRAGGPTVTAKDQDSIDRYGSKGTPMDSLYAASDERVQSLLEYVVARYKDPKTRVTSVNIDLLENLDHLLELVTITQRGRVGFELAPASVGDQIVMDLAVDGVSHRRLAIEHSIGLQLSSVETTTDFGLWDSGLWDQAVWA